MDYTTTGLVQRVKDWAAIPTSQPAFSTATLLRFLSDELHANIAPYIQNMRSEYFIKTLTYSISTANASYLIPKSAVGGTVREIKRIDSSSNEINVRQLSINSLLTKGSIIWSDSEFAFYLEGNYVVLKNYSDLTSESIKMYYARRPSTLVGTSACAIISAITTATNTVTCTAVPSAWTSASKVDLVQGSPPFEVFTEDASVTVAGTDITFSSLPTGLAVGDYVTLTGESPVAQIPWEAMPMLCQATVIKILESQDDTSGLEKAVAKYKEYSKRLMDIMIPRVEGELKEITNEESFI